MSTFQLYDSTGDREGFLWPLEEAGGGGLPSVTSWRQWGHSWAAGGYDDQSGLERSRTRISERIAGVMHLPPHAVMNEAAVGGAVMSALGSGAIGFGRILQRCVPNSITQEWPWEPDRFGVEAGMWGLNDIGTGPIHNSGSYWPEQGAMWNAVWTNTIRSVIARFIAGAVFYADDVQGLPPAVWYNTQVAPNNVGSPTPVMAPDFQYIPQGPGGVGIGNWQFKQDNRANTGMGYWWTNQNGDRMLVTVPVDYDTGHIAIRYLCPGSWFDGPVVNKDPFGVTNGTGGTPVVPIRTGAEHVRSPSAVTVVGGNVNAVVDCRGLANRVNMAGAGVAGTAGVIPAEDAMTHVSRHPLTPTPGTKQTITVTVGGMPAGGWVGFDSVEIQARQDVRPIVIMANVAPPADWTTLYGFAPLTVQNLAAARAEQMSDNLETVVEEFDDPGIMVADIRTTLAANPIDYALLVDPTRIQPPWTIGDRVERSGQATYSPNGDGTHPHAIGERLLIQAFLDALANADLPRGRGAIPFAPGRSLAYARSSGN